MKAALYSVLNSSSIDLYTNVRPRWGTERRNGHWTGLKNKFSEAIDVDADDHDTWYDIYEY